MQLCGGVAVEGQVQDRSLLLHPPPLVVRANASIGVRTTASQVLSQLYNDITSQMWNVGGVLCDLIIAVCMTYYVGFPHFSLLSLVILTRISFLIHVAAFATTR